MKTHVHLDRKYCVGYFIYWGLISLGCGTAEEGADLRNHVFASDQYSADSCIKQAGRVGGKDGPLPAALSDIPHVQTGIGLFPLEREYTYIYEIHDADMVRKYPLLSDTPSDTMAFIQGFTKSYRSVPSYECLMVIGKDLSWSLLRRHIRQAWKISNKGYGAEVTIAVRVEEQIKGIVLNIPEYRHSASSFIEGIYVEVDSTNHSEFNSYITLSIDGQTVQHDGEIRDTSVPVVERGDSLKGSIATTIADQLQNVFASAPYTTLKIDDKVCLHQLLGLLQCVSKAMTPLAIAGVNCFINDSGDYYQGDSEE